MSDVDVALVGDEVTQSITVHTADCPSAREAAAQGHPVLTMYGVADPDTLLEYQWHICMYLSGKTVKSAK